MAHRARVRTSEQLKGFCVSLWCSTCAYLELCSLWLHADARAGNHWKWQWGELTYEGFLSDFGERCFHAWIIWTEEPGWHVDSVWWMFSWGWLCWGGFCSSLSCAVSQKRPLTGLVTDSANGFITETPPLKEWGRVWFPFLAAVWFSDQPKPPTLWGCMYRKVVSLLPWKQRLTVF